MVREVINLQIGQCGNQVGVRFWESIAKEHGISPDGYYFGSDPRQLEKVDVFFRESREGYMPRTLLIDMENAVLNHIRSTTYGELYSPDSYISAKDGASNNYMEGYYSNDALKLQELVDDAIRREVECASCLQGVMFTHSSAGGTGSGLTMKIFEIIGDHLCDTSGAHWFFTVFPSTSISNTVTGPYNSCMTLQAQREAENVVVLDNEALYNICLNTLSLSSPTFSSINKLIASVMAGNTASLRFPGQINTDLSKLSYSLRTRSFMHWFIPSYAPLISFRKQEYRKTTVNSLVSQMMNPNIAMCDQRPEQIDLDNLEKDENLAGKSFSYAALFRGAIQSQDVDEAMTFCQPPSEVEDRLRRKLGYNPRYDPTLSHMMGRQREFHPQSCRQAFNVITDVPPSGNDMSVTMLRNTSSIKFKFLKIIREAVRMQSGSAFNHWYDAEKFLNCDPDCDNTLGSTIDELSQEWICTFGEEDGTAWPPPVSKDSLFTSIREKFVERTEERLGNFYEDSKKVYRLKNPLQEECWYPSISQVMKMRLKELESKIVEETKSEQESKDDSEGPPPVKKEEAKKEEKE